MNETTTEGTTTCKRCGAPCRVAPSRNEEAKMLLHARAADGNCANCAVAEWFELMRRQGAMRDVKPEQLLWPPVQEQFARLMVAAGADMKPGEIDWKKVVENWHLPFPGDKSKGARGKNPRSPPSQGSLF